MKTPLTPVQKDIKVINQKIRRLAAELGKSSPQYKEFVKTISRNFVISKTGEKAKVKGVVQIKNVKNADYNDYQKQIINRLQGMESYGSLKKSAVKSLRKQGLKKPSKKDINERIKEENYIRNKIDDTLTEIYDNIRENKLPTDIFDMYNNFRGHDTSYIEIRNMIQAVDKWKELKKEIQNITEKINNLEYVDEEIEQLSWQSNSGQLSLLECENALNTLENYYYNEREESD